MFHEYYRRTWEPENDISPDQTVLATSLRVPFLTTPFPRWHYVTGVVVCDDLFGPGIVPTEDEVRELGAHLQSYCEYYNQSFRDAMANFAPYDIDGHANLGWYMKRPDGGWCYRKRTWRTGVMWWPERDKTMPLTAVLAHNFSGWPFAKSG